MSCTKKGITKFLSLVPVVVSATPSVTSQQYMLLLKHILCNGPVCMNGTYPTTANVAFATGTPVLVGNNTYSVPVTVTGTINYLPYNPRCCCQSLKVSHLQLRLMFRYTVRLVLQLLMLLHLQWPQVRLTTTTVA